MTDTAPLSPDRTVRTTSPYCGVGCQMTLHVKDDLIDRVEAPFDAAPNYGSLCLKGRFGLDFATHPRRLRTPLIREGGPGAFHGRGWCCGISSGRCWRNTWSGWRLAAWCRRSHRAHGRLVKRRMGVRTPALNYCHSQTSSPLRMRRT